MTQLIHKLRQRRWRTSLIAAGLATAVVGAGVAIATNALAAAGCRVVYTVPSQWPGGFTGNVVVTNLGDPINGWQLTWTFPNGQSVQQAWSATISPTSGTVTAMNAHTGITALILATAFGVRRP